MTDSKIWQFCLSVLEQELAEHQFNTWILPLQVIEDSNKLIIFSPNRIVDDWIKNKFLKKIKELAKSHEKDITVTLKIGTLKDVEVTEKSIEKTGNNHSKNLDKSKKITPPPGSFNFNETLNKKMTFDTFLEGKCNILARAASIQIVNSPGSSYNPFLIYGNSGVGKTHLMHAIGNEIVKNNPDAKILYLNSERFVQEMISALQNKSIDKFKKYYRSAHVLLIDDIQFFAGKPRSQEEFFHTFNALLEGQQQIIMTCDRYPKEVTGIEERLQSRFSWGLHVAVEIPDLETRVMILMSKAKEVNMILPQDVAFFIAKLITSNVRELEGALRRVIANSRFTGAEINLFFAKKVLQDLVTLQDRLVSIESIQKAVAEYYSMRLSDLLSKKRTRNIARPRQIAMALAKELTNASLPSIGEGFAGRDHTTVIHACKKIAELKKSDVKVLEDYNNLQRLLQSGYKYN